MVAASLLESIYGSTYETLIVDHVFRPLGMDSCSFTMPERVMGHTVRSAGPPILWNVIPPSIPKIWNSAGRITCSLKDWGKFLREYIRYDNSALLPASSYDKILKSGTGYEAGFWVLDPSFSNEPYLFHNGIYESYSIVWVSPNDDIAIIVFANAQVADAELDS